MAANAGGGEVKDNDEIKLLMNSDRAKNIWQWLLKDLITDFYIRPINVTVSVWKSKPFVVFETGNHCIKQAS